ncbi:MAG: helix-turn-helix domain-containing protein [Acidimicrobiales bacterium]
MEESIQWMSTHQACEHLGVTLRTLYRFIDEGQLPAYKFGRVIRIKETDVTKFIADCRIAPGSLEHLYPEPKIDTSASESKRR